MQAIPLSGGLNGPCTSDGGNVWVIAGSTIVQLEANSGRTLGTWTGTDNAAGAVVAGGKVYVAGRTSPGSLYVIDPTQALGPVTRAAANLGHNPTGLALDGSRFWTANAAGSVSVATLQPTLPLPVTTLGGFGMLQAAVDDSGSVWMVDAGNDQLLCLDAAGAAVQSVNVDSYPWYPVFDGTNLWVPSIDAATFTVTNAATGEVVVKLPTGHLPSATAFDGERVLVSNGVDVSLFRAADLSFLGTVPTAAGPSMQYACSDGLHFWVTTLTAVLRF